MTELVQEEQASDALVMNTDFMCEPCKEDNEDKMQLRFVLNVTSIYVNNVQCFTES